MKFKLYSILCICLSVLFVSCEDDNDTPRPEPLDGSRTVLVYIVADRNGLNENNNNQNFADRDILEMMEGMKSVDASLYNLLVYVDDNNTPVLFRIAKDSKGNTYKDILKEYNEQVSTDVSVMKEVLNRAFYEYPADSYGLVYWSHADGWMPYPLNSGTSTRWIGQDRGDGTDQRMNINDFASVLSSIPHLEFLMFDACFSVSVEMAYAVKDYNDYFIGCPTQNPGPGAPYDKVVPSMFRKNAAVEMAKAYFESYEAIYDGSIPTNEIWTGGTSIAVLNCEKLDDLALITNQVLTKQSVHNQNLRQKVYDYDKRSISYAYYDMVGLMKQLVEGEAYKSWKTVFDSMVLYWQTTPYTYSNIDSRSGDMFSMEGTNGVTCYIPSVNNNALDRAYQLTAWYKDAGLGKLGW